MVVSQPELELELEGGGRVAAVTVVKDTISCWT